MPPFGGRGDDVGEASEFLDQRLGQRLGVALGNRHEEQEFKQLVIGKRVGAAGDKALPQPLTMAVIMWNFAAPLDGVRCAVRYKAARASLWGRA